VQGNTRWLYQRCAPWMLVLALILGVAWEAPASALPADATASAVPPKRCNDGIDNDGDGLTDFPADPDCGSANDNSEAPEVAACADGTDNDGDGRIDLDDPGCTSASDDSETDPAPETPAPRCSDGTDNDGDGRIDLDDPGCTSASDDSEIDPAAEQPPSDTGSTPPATTETREADPPAAATDGIPAAAAPRPLAPFPIVRLQGRLTSSGARITRLEVRAPAGSTIVVRCRGRRCPVTRVRRVSGARYVRVHELERRLPAGTRVGVSVTKPGWIGKHTRFRIRRGRAPLRTDACLLPGSTVPSPCG